MTKPTEKQEPATEEMPELTPANLKAIFHLALRACGGLAIPQNVLDKYPEDAPVIMRYDETNNVLNVFVPKKRPKRGKIKKTVSNHIIQPDRAILVPMEN